ncbi:Low calcium response locus protein S [Fibrisoma limi BUZ 3]|uniref:Low calcium response locus protein S n=1 Tax=Fibrisoma limi BUZ 3 TaxID=1185876 RepID=I2GSV5_9BACT|nr:Low calcium response locus protein S [Fibrisoma limi BUZ 3]
MALVRPRHRPPGFYNWKSKYGGMQVADVKRLKALEEENQRLKKMYAELSLENEVIKEALQKKW